MSPFSKKRIYFQFLSRKQLTGEDLHLELLHHGSWYRLKEKETAEGTRPSERKWVSQSPEQYYKLHLNAFQGVIPGYYRLFLTVGEANYIDTFFWIR